MPARSLIAGSLKICVLRKSEDQRLRRIEGSEKSLWHNRLLTPFEYQARRACNGCGLAIGETDVGAHGFIVRAADLETNRASITITSA